MGRDRRVEPLFSDLGRATRRGVRNCPRCGTLNGTRGKACKNKGCGILFGSHEGKDSNSQQSTDACKKLSVVDSDSFQIYSVRIRDKGPDYRNFVLLPPLHSNTMHEQNPDSEARILPQCYVDTCARNSSYQCSHIKAAQNCYSDTENLPIKTSVLNSINIPTDSKQMLVMLRNQVQNLLIQRCSKTSFAVKCNTSPKHPLGFLHVLFYKVNREDGNTEQKFLCSCRPFKMNNRRNYEVPNPAFVSANKFCVHYCACICAFASSSTLASEFEYFISQTISQVYPATLLSGLHLVTISEAGDRDSEQPDPNPSHISVEIMRENLSLLESISASDDASLQQVHLERVLSDQIVVTNMGDDPLGFGDPSALEVLDETDPQVSSHLTHISEILSHSNQNHQVVCQIFTTPDMQYAGAFTTTEIPQSEQDPLAGSPVLDQRVRRQTSPPRHSNQPKKSKESAQSNGGESNSEKITIVKAPSQGPTILEIGTGSWAERNQLQTKHQPIRPKHFVNVAIQNMQETNDLKGRINLENFERWIAGVNERMNGAMNYQFTEADALVDYLPQEQFECLKERISSGWKKKRLASPTVSISIRDTPPTGAFTKFTWKITNIIHIIHIFQSTMVPLKLSQFFTRSPNGAYSEWVPSPKQDGSKPQAAIPVLHCSTLKVGKLEPGAKESTPFIIEWIPDILPEARMGELTLRFQILHTGPIHTDEEMRACNSPIQRLVQQSTAFAMR